MLSIRFPFKPLSVNNAYQFNPKTGRRYPTKLCEAYKDAVRDVLATQEEFYINTEFHYLKLSYFFYVKNMYTKDGRINKRAGDVDNYVKILQDLLFEYLKVDDAFVVFTELRKLPALSADNFVVQIEKVDAENFKKIYV